MLLSCRAAGNAPNATPKPKSLEELLRSLNALADKCTRQSETVPDDLELWIIYFQVILLTLLGFALGGNDLVFLTVIVLTLLSFFVDVRLRMSQIKHEASTTS